MEIYRIQVFVESLILLKANHCQQLKEFNREIESKKVKNIH